MPLYEYKCHRCDKIFEVIQKFSDTPLQVHEECGGELERLISRSALQFKGTGWYVTDYAGNGKGGSGSKSNSDSGSSGKAEGKSESKADGGKSDSKPDTKTESKSESKPAASTTDK